MRPLAYFVVALVLAVVQAVLLRWLGGGWLSVQLLVPLLAWLGLRAANVEGVVAAAGAGYVLDVFAGTPRGLSTFLAVVLFLFGRAAGMAIDVRGRVGFAILSGASCVAWSAAAMVLQRWAGPDAAAPGAALIPRLLGEAVLTGLLAPPILLALNRLDTLLGREEPGLVP